MTEIAFVVAVTTDVVPQGLTLISNLELYLRALKVIKLVVGGDREIYSAVIF